MWGYIRFNRLNDGWHQPKKTADDHSLSADYLLQALLSRRALFGRKAATISGAVST